MSFNVKFKYSRKVLIKESIIFSWKSAICLICVYIFVTFIAWSLEGSKQNHLPSEVGRLSYDIRRLQVQNGSEHSRSIHSNVKELTQLRDLVQRRLINLQNPKNCSAAKKVICKPKSSGFGSCVHHFTFCLIVAYATERTLILKSKGWKYAPEGWESIFLPVSTNCTSTMNNTIIETTNIDNSSDKQAIVIPTMQKVHSPIYMPFAIPEDFADRLTQVHINPEIWWIGQFVDYLIRPNRNLKLYLRKRQRKIVFNQPIVGLHIRRTDKIYEANFFDLKEYMEYAHKWFEQHVKNNSQPRYVFIATDDPNVIREAERKYHNYTFFYNKEVIPTAKNSRYSTDSLKGLMLDVHSLVMCDFVICTMTSNVCRLVYELKESRDGTASERLISLDVDYYFCRRYPGKRAERILLQNETAQLSMTGFSALKDKRKNPKIPIFTADRSKSRVVMPVYPDVKEKI